MIEWIILVLNLATAVYGGQDGIAQHVIAPLPGTATAIYASDNVDEVASPIPGSAIDEDDDGAAK